MILTAFVFGAPQVDGGDVFCFSRFQGTFEIDPFCCTFRLFFLIQRVSMAAKIHVCFERTRFVCSFCVSFGVSFVQIQQ
jgi:hypothetical protein